jgi:hypothetical protein
MIPLPVLLANVGVDVLERRGQVSRSSVATRGLTRIVLDKAGTSRCMALYFL